MFGMKLTPTQRLHKAAAKIMNEPRYKPMAGIFMMGERVVSDRIPTACTDGLNEWYSPTFIDEISDAVLRGAIVHENKHKRRRDLHTFKPLADIDMGLANQAMDYVINQEIVDENPDGFCQLGEGWLYDEQYNGMSTSDIFNILLTKQKQDPNGGGGGGQDPNGTGEGQPSGGGDGHSKHDWEAAKKMSEEEKREVTRGIDQAQRQGVLASQKMGEHVDRKLLDELSPKVAWDDALRDFWTSTMRGADQSTWRKPNRRYMAQGIYMPSHFNDRIGKVCIWVDASGSIMDRALTVAVTEVSSLCNMCTPDSIDLLYWGTSISGHETYEPDEYDMLSQLTNPKDAGGTKAECMTEYAKHKGLEPEVNIVITDGEVWNGWGDWDTPVCWLVMDNPKATPDCGHVIHIDTGDM
jgi:predicted metal-dependent peptidase